MNKLMLCMISLFLTINAHAQEKIIQENIIKSYIERIQLLSNVSGSYTKNRNLSGPAKDLYNKQKSENKISMMWDLVGVLNAQNLVDFAFANNEIYIHDIYIPNIERKEQPSDTESFYSGSTFVLRDNIRNKIITKEWEKTTPIIDGYNPLFLGMMFYVNNYNNNYYQLITDNGIGVPPNLYQVNYYENKVENISQENINQRNYVKITATDKYFEKTNEYCVAWLDPSLGYLVNKLEVRGIVKKELRHTYETTENMNIKINNRNVWIPKKAMIKEFYSNNIIEGMEIPLSEICIELKKISIGDGDKKIIRIAQ